MENNKGYLRHFGIIFLIAVLSGILLLFVFDIGFSNTRNQKVLLLLFQQIPIIIYFINIGIATRKWKAIGYSIAVHLGISILSYFAFPKNDINNKSQTLIFLLQEIFFVLPFFVFFLFVKIDTRKLPVIALALLLVFGVNGLYQAEDGLNNLTELFSLKLHISTTVSRIITFIFGQMIYIILMCELLNYGEGKNNGSQTRIINPGNEYDKLSATVTFWSVKTFIYLSLLGCVGLVSSYSRFSRYYESSFSFLKWFYIITIVFTILALIAAAWYLRKFLLEYFINYNFTSRFLYWFLLLPVVGSIAWLVMAADSDKQTEYKDRKKTIEDFSKSSPSGIIIVFIILMALQLLATLMSGQLQGILTILLSAGLFAALVLSHTGYYLNLWLNILLLVLITALLLLGKDVRLIAVLFPLLLLNTIQLFLIYPAFHFDAFSYVSYDEEEKPWEPGQDLF